MIYIIGHQQPDLDSAVSAVLAEKLFLEAECYGYKSAKAVLAGEPNLETQTVFAKFGINLPQVLSADQIQPDDSFVLVDHNEQDQRLKGITNEQVAEIIDHHKFSANFSSPIFITAKPWGSTASIIYFMMQTAKIIPDKNMAGLALSAIISDTVGLQSPTTTEKDREYAQKLAEIAQVNDVKKLAYEIFQAKSNISGLSVKQVLTKDYKVFDFGGTKVLVNQIETVEQQKIIDNSQEYLAELASIKTETGVNHAYSLITDILNTNSKCLTLPEDEALLKKTFANAVLVKTGVYDIGPIMSRKKEVVPNLEKAVISLDKN